MASRGRHEGKGKAKTDLINLDAKNELNPLKPEVVVRKLGGLFVAPNGAVVDIPAGASSGRRERIMCVPISSTARGILGPWLGPNLRLASEMIVINAPINFKQPVALFLPFSFAAARELTVTAIDDKASVASGKDPTDGDTTRPPEIILHKTPRANKNKVVIPTSIYFNPKAHKRPRILDTRSVFLLSCKLGDEQWESHENFAVLQPTIHHQFWPSEVKSLVSKSVRWPDVSSPDAAASTAGTTATATTESSAAAQKRFSSTAPRAGKRTGGGGSSRDTEPLEQIRRIENYCGGVCLTLDELNHCFVLVVATRAENFVIGRDGGYIRSPLLHPFFSIRVPKRSCLEDTLGSFKALEIRPNWAQVAVQFDSQLSEIEGCSDIYELDMQNVILRRPATVRIPLPQWFIDRRNRGHENWDQTSTTVGSSDRQDGNLSSRGPNSDGVIVNERPLMLLYQPPGYRRQIIWQPANTDDTREDFGRRKSRFQVSRKDTLVSVKCKIENPLIRLGWSFLTVGIRGGPWHAMKKPVYFTKRTAFFETNILGRFVLVGPRDAERTPASKLAHLMTRVEALSVAPPGALLVCLQVHLNSWKIMANIYPEDKLVDIIQEQVHAGYIPLVQMAGGVIRRVTSLSNAIQQAQEIIQLPKEILDQMEKVRKKPPFRHYGTDIIHMLMFGGLCLEFRVTGNIRLKPVNQCEAIAPTVKQTKTPSGESADALRSSSREPAAKRGTSVNIFGEKVKAVRERRNLTNLLTNTANMQQHELLHEASCTIEIEPIANEEPQFVRKCVEKIQMVTDMLRKTAKKQEGHSDDEEEDDEDMDDSDSEENGGRHSSHSDNHPPAVYEGDDGPIDDFTKEAQEHVMKDQPLAAATVNAELLRRMNNVFDKNKMGKAVTFMQRVHDIYHAGTIEVWLVPPESLPQLAIPEKTVKPVDEFGLSTTSAFLASEPINTSTPDLDAAASDTEPPLTDGGAEKDEDRMSMGRETHNAIRWNPMESAQTTDGANSLLPDMHKYPDKPLVVLNVLIDPELAILHLRTPKGAGATVAQKKTPRGRSQTTSRNNPAPDVRQRNKSAAAAANRRRAQTAPLMDQRESEFMKTDEDDELDVNGQGNMGELQYLTGTQMRSLARHINEPQKLADAVGLPVDEVNRIVLLMHRNTEHPNAYFAYDVLRSWKRSYRQTTEATAETPLGDDHPTVIDEPLEAVAGDTPQAMMSRSPLTDLIDVLQSLGYFEAVEIVQAVREEANRVPSVRA